MSIDSFTASAGNRLLYSPPQRGHTVPRPPKDVVLSKKEVGQRLRSHRQARGIAQGELARMIKTHQTSISEVERGIRGLTVQQVVKIAKALRVSTDDILLNGKARDAVRSLRSGRLLHRFRLIEKLPPTDQKALLNHLNALLKSRGVKTRRVPE